MGVAVHMVNTAKHIKFNWIWSFNVWAMLHWKFCHGSLVKSQNKTWFYDSHIKNMQTKKVSAVWVKVVSTDLNNPSF